MDLLLHPLRSELNFPIGDKHPLPASPDRWNCAIHVLDAIFVGSSEMSVEFHESARAKAILSQLKAVLEQGYSQRKLQHSPHLILLDVAWYHETVLPVLGKWTMLWLESNHVAGVPAQLEAYITSSATPLGTGVEWDAAVEAAGRAADADHVARSIRGPGPLLNRLHEHLSATLDSKSFVLANLAREWLSTYRASSTQSIPLTHTLLSDANPALSCSASRPIED